MTVSLFEAHTAPTEGLEPWPITSEELEGTEMTGRILWTSPDGTRATGVWHATPGVIRGCFLTDEVSYVIEGRLTVTTPHDGQSREVRAGDVMVMAKGVEVEWRIHEPTTKLWNVYDPERLPL